MFLLLVPCALALESVRPTLAWAPGDSWAIAFARTTSRTGSEPVLTTHVSSRWIATVAATPHGLEVRTSDYKLGELTGFAENDPVGAYTAALFAAAPSFRIQPTGRLGELVDIPATRADADRVLDSSRFLNAESRAELRALVPDAQLRTMLMDWWTPLVGAWNGVERKLGESSRSRMQVPVPALQNRVVPLDVTFTYAGPTPCVDGEAPSCEAFISASSLDPTGLPAVMTSVANDMASAKLPVDLRVESISIDNTTRLVTEADDLRPRSLAVARTTRMTGEQRGKPFDVVQEESRTWTFSPSTVSTTRE